MASVYYDIANGHRLRFKETRPDGKMLLDDLDDGSRVICGPEGLDVMPRYRLPMLELEPLNLVEFFAQ